MTKSKKFLSIFLAVAFALLTCGMALAVMLPSLSTSKVDRQVYADGDSTLSSMKTTTYGGQTFYQIENADQLTALAWSISVEGNATWASRNFELTKDVDIQLAGLNGSAIWTPIGTNSNPFKGKFNGNGHTVSGIVTGFEGSADDNLGLFGRVEGTSSSPAMIYDIVIDDFAFADYSSYPDLAGRLVGYIANAVLVDVYDYSFAMGDTDPSRPLKTIGTVGTNVKYYTGGTFTANGTTYVSGTNFDATHGGQISDGRQFDWSNSSGITHAGYSLYVKAADASVAKIYAKGDSNKTNIAPYKIAITTSGSTATALTVYSANYFNELPQENEAKAANGQPVIEPVVGKKLSGWTLSGASGSYTKISEINTTSFASSNKYVQADFTDKTYTIAVMRSSGTGSWASLGSVRLQANDTWANAVTKIEALRAGYFLTDLYKELTNSTHYYTNSISYNDNWDVVHNKNYPNGLRLNDWAESNITLYSTWVGKVSNANINFVNTNDDGAKLDSMTNLAIAYTNGEPVNSPDLALTTTGELGKYTFRAVADQNLTFTFKLPAGYEATQPSASGGATATLTGGTDGNYTISISGLTSSGGTITIPIQRKTITLNVSAANFTLSLSGNTSHTKISGSTITTKVGETFNIIATPAKGYEYSSHSVTEQFTTVGTQSVASNDVVTFPVTVNTFGSSQTLTITAKAKAFTIILDYDASVYASGVQLPQVSISTGSSQTVTATGDNRWDNLTPTNLVTIKTPGNAYFMPGVVTLTTNPDGTLSGGNGDYQIQPVGDAETIPGGAVFNIKVTYAKRQYTATYGGRFATISGEGTSSKAENFTAIKDVNGTELTDYNKVITITPSHTTYSFGDKITLSYNIVSDYYEFVGWYYSTGEYISNQNNAQITAGTSDVTVYAVVRGKTATFTVSTGNLIENYDGVENATHTSTLALSTPNVTQLSFTYSSPDSGAVSFSVKDGYTGGRYILSNAANASAAYAAWKAGTAYLLTTTANSVSGYKSFTLESGDSVESVFFDHSGWKLYPIVTQRTISIVASAGDGGVVADSGATSARNYYFGSEGFDITYAINAFTKTGYTPTGWTFTVGGTQNVYDNSIVSGDRYLIDFTDYSSITSYLGKTITLNRTYTANTYKLYFKQNAGETLATEGLLHDATGYYKNVVFDQQIGSLPTITKQGYQFVSWGVSTSDVYKTADDTTLNAQWNTLSYTVRIDFNGGNVSGATYQNVTVAYDGSIGTFGSYTANGLASLASSVKREGFKFDAWHYMIPSVTADGTTYEYGKEVSDKDALNSTTFPKANFASTTNPVIFIYAGWTFDSSAYSATVGNVNTTYNASNVQFNVSVNAKGSSYSLTASQSNLPTNAGVTISSFKWQYNGSAFSGTAHTYGPEIKNVSQSGTYSVTFTLSDTSATVKGVTQIATPTIDITASANVTIGKATIDVNINNRDGLNDNYSKIKELADVLGDALDEFSDQDGLIEAFRNSSSYGDYAGYVTDLIGIDSGKLTLALMFPYYKLPLIYLVLNPNYKDTLVTAIQEKLDKDISNSANQIDYEYVETHCASLDSFEEWVYELETNEDLEFLVGWLTTYKPYDDNASFVCEALQIATGSQMLSLGTNHYYASFSGTDFTTIADAGVHDVAVEVVSKVGTLDVGNFTNLIVKDGKYYVPFIEDGDIAGGSIIPSLTTLTMTETTGVDKSEVYTFTLTADYTATSEYTKIEANVSTSAATAGVYRFIDGGLVINSFKVYVDEGNYFTVTNSNGNFTVTGAPSGMQTTDLNLDNILLYIDGEFEIQEVKSTTMVTLGSQAISANSERNGLTVSNISEASGYNISVASVKVEIDGSAETISISAGKEVYYSQNGTFVFQLIGNGTSAPRLYATKYVKTATVSVESLTPVANRHLLSIEKWQEGSTYLETLLSSASAFASSTEKILTINASGSGDTLQFVAIYSDATYVTVSSVKDDGSNAGLASGNAFVNFADTAFKVSNTAASAYTLTEWTSAQNATVGADGTVAFTTQAPKTSLVAHYSLAAPTGSVSAVNQDASKDGLSASSLVSNISLTNRGDAITYSYKWFRLVGEEYQEVSTIVSTTAGTGTYAVEVTASQNGYDSVTSQKLDFEVEFNKVDITISTAATADKTYNNEDFANSFTIDYTVGSDDQSMTVKQALNNNAVADGNKLIITSLQKDGENVVAIKDVGTYTLSFSLFNYAGNAYNPQNIYNLKGTQTITITVGAYRKTITQQEGSFSKQYGASEPSLSRTIDGVNGEKISVTFTRELGEAVGSYAIEDVTTSGSAATNYILTVPSNDSWFTITARTGLVLSADLSGTVTHTYNAKASTGVTYQYDSASNSFILTVVQGEGTWSGTLKLSNFKEKSTDGLERNVNASQNLLDGFTFTVDGTKDVGSYGLKVTGTSTASGAKFSINVNSTGRVVISALSVELSQQQAQITKVYGDPDVLTKEVEIAQTGEKLSVTFTRAAGENVGTYKLTVDSWTDDNYVISVPEQNDWFTIEAIEDLIIQATITEVYSRKYNATAPDSAVSKDFVNGKWQLTVKSGSNTWKTFVLSGFKEISAEKSINRTITPNATTLSGMSFTIASAAKHVGEYSITASKTGENKNYVDIELLDAEGCIKITKATITIVQSDIQQSSKTYGSPDPLMLWDVAGAGETVSILFTREEGENVDSYDIVDAEIQDEDLVGNYDVVISNNVIFTINAYEGLQISATPEKTSIAFTYNNNVPTISLEHVNASSYKLVIKMGDETKEILLKDFTEKFDTDKPMSAVTNSTLTGITFKIDKASKNVGNYNIIATGTNANYPGGFVFASNVNVSLKISQAELIINESAPLFTKTYGDDDGSLRTQIRSTLGESVDVSFSRNTANTPAGEKIGTHALTGAFAVNSNYKATLQSASLQIVARQGLVLKATVSGTVSHTYDANKPTTITASYLKGQNYITLTISNGDNNWGTIRLSNLTETATDYTKSPELYQGMLDGLTFSIVGDNTANVGEYTLSVSGTTTDSQATFKLTNPSFNVLEITPKDIVLTEENATIRKTYGTDDASPLQITIHDDQTNEDVAITVTRELGEDVGKYKLLDASSNNLNYNAVLNGTPEWFIIDAVGDLKLSVTISGSIEHVYNAKALDATVTQTFDPQTNTWTITVTRGGETFGTFTLSDFIENGTGIDNREITPTENTLKGLVFALVNPSKNVGNYTITLAGKNDNYASVVLVGGDDRVAITKATISLNASEASFEKVYGADDPLLEKTIQGAGEEVVLSFTRAEGENVGSYNIESIVVKDPTNATNYNEITVPQGAKFTIKAYEGLQISATPSQTHVELTYNATAPTIQKVFENGAFKLVISNGDDDVEISLSAIQEMFTNKYEGNFDDSPLTITQLSESVLSGIEFSLKNIQAGVGTYQIEVSCTNANYPGGFVFANSATVELEITKATLEIDATDYPGGLFSKTYGSADPKLNYTFEGFGSDEVEVTFAKREGAGTAAGEAVGSYDLLSPTTTNPNYKVAINPASDNNLFVITALEGLLLRGTLSGDAVSKAYNGVALASDITVEWNAESQNFTLTVKYTNGTTFATFILGDFTEYDTNDANPSDEPLTSALTSAILNGFTFTVQAADKNVGVYTIVASGKTDAYTSFAFKNNTQLLTITPYKITLDESDASFEKYYGTADATAFTSGLTKQIAGVGDETISVTFTRGLGENVGSYAISKPQYSDKNYEISLAEGETNWFTIKAIDDLALNATVSGTVSHEFINETPTASLSHNGSNWIITISSTSGDWGTLTLTNFTEVRTGGTPFTNEVGLKIDGSTLKGLVIGIQNAAATAGDYNLTITTQLNNANYPANFAFTSGHEGAVKITKATFTVSQDDADFSSMYGSDESKTKTFTKEVTDKFGYQFEITFTRTAGKDVGEYQILSATTTSDNYTQINVPPNMWYQVKPVETLTLTGTTDKTQVELTYSAKDVSLSLDFVEGKWVITVSNGTTDQTITFTGFKENFDTGDVDADVTEKLLESLTLAFDKTARDVGTYTIKNTGFDNANYPAGIIFADITVNVNAYAVTVAQEDVAHLTKVYGSPDPSPLTATIDGIQGEEIQVTFERESAGTPAGEYVGGYKLSITDWDDKNYAVTMGEAENEWFKITTKAGLKIGAVLSGDVKQLEYAGTQESSVSIKCNNDETFTITVTVAGTGYEFTLSGFKEIEEIEEIGPIQSDPYTQIIEESLQGITFALNAAIADKGFYNLVASGSNNMYAGFEFIGESDVIEIIAKNIELNSSNFALTKQYGSLDADAYANNIVKDIATGVGSETISVSFTRESGENVDSYNILSAEVVGNQNYTVSLADGGADLFTITAISDLAIHATITDAAISHEFINETPSAALSFNGRDWIVTISSASGAWGTLTLNLSEVRTGGEEFVNKNGFDLTASTLNGLVIGIQNAAVTVGDYNLTITTQLNNANYPANFAFTSGHEGAVKITKATFTVSQNDADFSSMYGSDESKTNTFTREVTGVNNYKFNITFTRETGSDVGEYQISSATTQDVNYNTEVVVSTPNEWYEIKEVAGLTLSATASKNLVELIYNHTTPKISTKFVESGADSYWQLVISNGSAEVAVDLKAFQEDFDSPVSITDVSILKAIFDDITFEIENIGEGNQGTYTIKANCTDVNYPGGFNFGKVELKIKPAPLTISSDSPIISKVYGSSDPSVLSYTFDSEFGERVEVHFGRDPGEDVGFYDLTNPVSQNTNYDAVINPEDGNNLFEITAQAGLTLSVEITGDAVELDYDGARDITVTAEYQVDAWVLKLMQAGVDEPLGTFTLSTFNQVQGDKSTQLANVNNQTLKGFTFKLDRAVKDVGIYTIQMDANTNPNYPGGLIFANSAEKLIINQKHLTVENIVKEFDQSPEFDTSNSTYSNTATINGLVGSESVVLKGQFTSIGVGKGIAINNLAISGEASSNYVLDTKSSTGDIVKNTTDTITTSLAKTLYVYGEIDNTLSAFAPTVMLGADSVAEYVEITPSITTASYSTGDYLNQGSYQVTFTVESDYYTTQNYEVVITVSQLDVTVVVDGDITKVYDRTDNVVQSLSLQTVLGGDNVTVSGKYNDAQPAADKQVTFTLAGADYGNYNLTNENQTGEIVRAEIVVTANLNTVSGGFVDGVDAAGTTQFTISYPLVDSAEETLGKLTHPTKKGYTFLNWTYGDDRQELNAENINDVLDGALDAKALSIYASWQIQTFTVTVNVNAEQGSYTISPEQAGNQNVYTYNYWDTITITPVPKTGYIQSQQSYVIENIDANKEVEVKFVPASIEFTVSVNKGALYSADEVEVRFDSAGWLVGEDNDSTISATRSILFNALDGVLAKDFLPQISVYGYTLASWTSGEQVVEVDAETKLLDLILALNNSFTQDIELSFSANFDANKHQITFNTDGGSPEPSAITATFGQAVGTLPVVTKTGYDFINWVDDEGVAYVQETIFSVDEDVQLTATWGVGIYDVKVTISHASVEIKDSDNRVMTPDGGNYRLSYTESYTITVTPDAGYNVSGEWTQSQPASFELSYVGEGYTSASLTNLSGDGSITIPVEAILNTITLNGISHAQVSVKVGEDEPQQLESSDGVFTFTAHTDESVEITITPDEGYSVAYDEITSGTGYVSSQSDNVYALKAFTSDVEIAFKTTANTYLATFSYSSGATSVGIISGGESQGQGILVSTGTNLVVKPNFEYGYEFASVSAEGATYSVDDETGNITFSNFTKAFTVTITGKPMAFALKATVFAIDSDHNVQDAQGFAATVKESELFGSEVTFTASKPAEASGYRFVGWFEGTLEAEEGVLNYNTEDIISTDESYKWVVAGERELTAVYEYAIFTIRAYVEGKGQIIYNENVVADSENGLYFSQQFNYSNEIVLNAQPASGYEFKEWRNGDQTYSAQQQLSITVDQDLSLTAAFVAGDLTFNLEAGVLIDGALYTGESVEGLSYGKVEWGTYSEEGGFVKDPDGDTTTVPTKTDASVYVQVTVNKGYTFDNIYPVQGGREGEINLISSTESDEKIVNIYQITSLSAEFDGEYSFVATFVAQTTTFNIIFQEKVADNEYRQIDAGRIVVDSSAGVKPSGSNSSNVVVDAVTETTFKVTANLRFGMSFVDTNMVSATAGTISDPTVSPISDISSGLVSSLTFTVSDFTGSEATIVIYVTSATYSINFVEYDAEKEQTISLGTLNSIKIGDKLTLPEGMAIPTKDDYAFIGFYSDTLGDGEQYMDSTGNGIIWSQNGYKWDTHGYAKLSNFTPSQDGDGGTFTLYAVFVINKSAITISAVPSKIQDVPPTVGARVVITNFSDANTWMDDAQPFYVEVLYKASINISAPIYADYQFAYWQIEKTNDKGETEIVINENATIEGLGHYGYPQIKLVANYNARVAVTATAGGSVYYTYEVEGDEGLTEVRVDGEAYVPTTSAVTLHAQPANGYLFKGWYKGDELVSTEPDCRLDTPTLAATYHAEFEGETVTIHIGEYDSTYAHITSIMANGSDVNFSTGSFQARVGDEIAIYLSQLPDNFEIVWEGADIQNLISHYGYVVDIEDFTDYELTITPVISQMRGTVTITVSLEGETGEAVETELANAGTVSYINADGGKVGVVGSVEFEGLIGDALQIEIIAKEYYKVGSVVYNGADVTANIDPETNILILTLSLNAAKTFKITVNFIRDMWIDYAGDDYNLVGDGTGDNPYIISSAEDLSYIAYMINERGKTNFANASYKLGANIDLTGKYWSPIGTEDNPFNGTFDYSAYSISNVRVDPAYDGDLARDGVFGYLGDRATFPEANNDLMIALIIVGVIIFLILLALLIFLLIRRKRKKELEELANS